MSKNRMLVKRFDFVFLHLSLGYRSKNCWAVRPDESERTKRGLSFCSSFMFLMQANTISAVRIGTLFGTSLIRSSSKFSCHVLYLGGKDSFVSGGSCGDFEDEMLGLTASLRS